MIITTHTSLKCKHRSRPTPVQRKHSPEKRRCSQALKSHTLWKCKKRSRPTPVQRKRSHDITQVQKPQSVSAATEGEPAVTRSNSDDFGSGLPPTGRTRFEAKRPRHNSFSHGYKAIKHNKQLTRRISHAFGLKAWRIYSFIYLYIYIYI